MTAHFQAGTEILAPVDDLTGPIPEQLAVSLFAAPATISTRPTRLELTWPELVARLSTHERRRTKDGRGWSGATYTRGTTRKNVNVVEWSVAGADIEHVTLDDVQQLCEHLEQLGLAYVMYSTFAFEPEEPRVRFAIPLTKAVPAEGYPDVWRRSDAYLFGGKNDPNTKDASRMLYVPTAPEDATTLVKVGEGLALDWEKLPAAPTLGTIKDGATKRGADVGVGRETMNFLLFGAPVGEQRLRALAATRSLLAAGKSIEETADKVWQGLRASPCGDPAKPWTYEDALAFAEDLAKREPTTLEQWPELTLGDDGGKAYFSPGEPANGQATVAPKDQVVASALLNGKRHTTYADGRVVTAPVESPTTDGEAAPSEPTANGTEHQDATGAPAEEATPRQTDAEPSAPQTFNQTEMGIAEVLVHLHGQDLRFCHQWGSWLAWDGRRHRRDLTGEAPRRAKATVRSVYTIAAKTEDDKQRRALLAWAKGLEKSATVTSMLKLAQSEPDIPILPEDMDADPFLFNVLNGTVDLRTGNLRPHDRADTITKLAPVAYDQAAECPTFLAFLERVVPDEHVRAFLRRFVGYSLTGDTREQCLLFLHGGGANGKSTLLTALQAVMGDYARQAAPELLVSRGGDRHPTELADLFGARAVVSVEVDEGKRLAETLVKQMTGGDRMKARFMRTDFFEWAPTHKLFLAANHRPEIRGTDYAIWRRIHLVPFVVTIPEGERDPKLGAKLLAELPGILNWALAGCLDWQQDGIGVPKAVRDATEAYRAEQDILADFLVERCVVDPQAWAKASDLHKAYTAWCEEGGHKAVNTTAFGRRLTERGFRAARVGKAQARAWKGLRLRLPDEPADTFGGADGFRHDFPDESLPGAREDDMPKNASNVSADDNPSADDGTCPACRRDLASDELPCPACVEVTA